MTTGIKRGADLVLWRWGLIVMTAVWLTACGARGPLQPPPDTAPPPTEKTTR